MKRLRVLLLLLASIAGLPPALLRFSKTCKFCSSQRLQQNTFSLPSIIIMVTANEPWKTDKQNGWKSIYHNWQVWPFDPVKANFCFLRGPLGWLTAAKTYFVIAVNLSRVCMFLKIAINSLTLFFLAELWRPVGANPHPYRNLDKSKKTIHGNWKPMHVSFHGHPG